MISDNTLLAQDPEILSTVVDDQAIFMSMEDGTYYASNEIGSRIWDLMGEPIRFEDLVGKLVEEYDVELETCKNDTLALLSDMLERKLIKVN